MNSALKFIRIDEREIGMTNREINIPFHNDVWRTNQHIEFILLMTFPLYHPIHIYS